MVLASGGFYFGYYLSIFQIIGEDFLSDGIDHGKKQGYLAQSNVLFCLGAAIGALVSGFAVNAIGRIKTLILAEVIAIISLLGFIYWNLYIYMIVRFCCGFVSGVLVHTDMVINMEIVPKSISPGSAVAFQGFITIGILISTLIQHFLDNYIIDQQTFIKDYGY